MTVVGRLIDGDLQLGDELSERLPAVTDGLVAHFPMDGTEKGIIDRNILDYSTWIIGTSGSQSGFVQNGDGNSIIEDYDPFGNKTAVWQTLNNDVDSNADGGWRTDPFPIDNTKLYRFSVWVKRKVLGNGRFYFGCFGYDDTITNVGVYYNSDGTTNNTNPYFNNTLWDFNLDQWILVVGHIFPYDHTDTSMHPDSGYYDIGGNKIANISMDFRWRSNNAYAAHRTYLYYSTDPSTHQLWVYPRVDLCDGSEPTIEDLILGLNGDGGTINPLTVSNCTITSDGIAIEEGTENLLATVGGAAQDWSKWSHWNNTSYWGLTEQYYDPQWGMVFKGTKDGANNTTTYIYDYYPYSYVIDDVLTFSCWMRVNKDISKTISFYVNSSSGGQHNVTSMDSKTIDFKVGEWQYITWTSGAVTEAVSGTGGFGLSMGSGWDGCIVEVAYPQFEKKSFATSFVNGSRSSGVIQLPLEIINPYEGTIRFKINFSHIPNWCRIVNIGQYSSPVTTDEFKLIFDDENDTVEPYKKQIYFGIQSKDSASICTTSQFDVYRYTDYDIAITWSDTTRELAIYIDGILKQKITPSSSFIFPDYDGWNVVNINNYSGKGNFKIWDMSFYNRALSEDEIKKLANSSFSLTQEGHLITSKVVEEPNGIPDDAIYVPLSTDAYNKNKIGNYNLISNPSFEEGSTGWTLSGNMSISSSQVYEGSNSLRFYHATGAGAQTTVTGTIYVSPNTTYILSAYFKNNLSAGNFYVDYMEYDSSNTLLTDGAGAYSTLGNNTWHYKMHTFTTKSTASYVKVRVVADGTPTGEAFVDKILLRPFGGYGVEPVSEANTVYENSAVWVGNATTNIIGMTNDWNTQSGWNSFWVSQTKSIETNGLLRSGSYVIKSIINETGAGGPAYKDYTGLIEGQQYTVSAYVKSPNRPIRIWLHDNIDGAGSLYSGTTEWKTCDKWTRLEITFTCTSKCGIRIYFHFDTGNVGDIVYVTAPQLEAKPFSTPFVNGTRNKSDLEFNLHESIGLDWNGDWSIVYWKMPVGTHTDTLTGYNLESIGCNSNSVGGQYRWWGKANGSDILYAHGTVGSFNPSDYFNKWHMVSVVKNGSTVTWKFWNIGGTTYTRSETWGTINSNGFVTQYGYDLKLGGWDNNNVCNTYFKDLIVVKRTLTGDELNALANVQMSSYPDRIQIQSQLREGVVL